MKKILLFLIAGSLLLTACGLQPAPTKAPLYAPLETQRVVLSSTMNIVEYSVDAAGKINLEEFEITHEGLKKIKSGESCPVTNFAVRFAVDCKALGKVQIRVERPLFSEKLQVFTEGLQ